MRRSPVLPLGIAVALFTVAAGGTRSGLDPVVTDLPAPIPHSGFALGINEAVAIPAKMARTMPLDKQVLELTRRAKLSAGLGAAYVRGHTGNYPSISQQDLAADPTLIAQGDAWVQAVQAAGIEPTLMVSPWPANDTGSKTTHYLPDDFEAYETYVRFVVERYDGDGIEDMPGLMAPVRYWEADNEPDLKNSRPARSANREYDPATFCTPQEYGQVLIASARAIKAAFPEAVVLNGGLYKPHSTEGARYFRDLAAVPGAMDAIDLVSVHAYHDTPDGDRLAAAILNERAYAPSLPVWVTETSYGTDEGITSEDQARMLVTLSVRAAMAGADKLFWHSLEDKPASAYPKKLPVMFGYSLLDNDGQGGITPKPVGEVFRHFAAFLKLHDLNGCVPDGDGAVRLQDGTVLLYEGTRKARDGGGDLRTGLPVAPGVRVSAPGWITAG